MRFQMISTAAHIYAARRLQPGDEFTVVSRSDRNLLIALGRARDPDPVDAEKPRRTYRRRDMKAEG